MKIQIKEDIKKLSEQTIFSYREIYVLSMFVDFDILETILDIIALSGESVGMWLIKFGIPQQKVYELLHCDVEYIK